MNANDFWALIELSRRDFDPNLRDGNQERQAELLEQKLRALPPQELEDYERLFSQFFFMPYTWDTWAAVYLIEGGCSDDGFDYFRAWLISMGRDAFNSVVSSADNLAEIAYLPGVEVISFPDILSLGAQIYEEKAGRRIPESCYQLGRPDEPSGTPWNEDKLSELEDRLPKVWEKIRDSWPSEQLT